MKKTKRRQDPKGVTNKPCARCLALARDGKIRFETVMFIPEGAFAPLSRTTGTPCCYDCASADGLMALGVGCSTFEMARIAVGNDRQAHFRLPFEMHAAYGLAVNGLMKTLDIDIDMQHKWLDKNVPEWRSVEEVP